MAADSPRSVGTMGAMFGASRVPFGRFVRSVPALEAALKLFCSVAVAGKRACAHVVCGAGLCGQRDAAQPGRPRVREGELTENGAQCVEKNRARLAVRRRAQPSREGAAVLRDVPWKVRFSTVPTQTKQNFVDAYQGKGLRIIW